MDFIVPEILSGELVPVLLGCSVHTAELSLKIFRRYGVVSHVFCNKIPLSLRFSAFLRFHKVGKTRGQALMTTALLDFAEQMGNADVILYLFPCSEEYVDFLWDQQEALESRYVLADRRTEAQINNRNTEE